MEIEVYDKRKKLTATIQVEQLSDNIFLMLENEIFTCDLTFGTEFETRINKDGKHEIIRIINDSAYITRRFLLTTQFKASEYQVLGDAIIKQGGFWQVDLGSITTINLPKECQFNLDEIFKAFDFKPTEIIE
jgi:hypothetical protein